MISLCAGGALYMPRLNKFPAVIFASYWYINVVIDILYVSSLYHKIFL